MMTRLILAALVLAASATLHCCGGGGSGDGDADFESDADGDTGGDADSDADDDTDGDVDADGDTGGDADSDADEEGDADADADGDRDQEADGDMDGDTDGDSDTSSISFVLHFISDIPESIWVDETDDAWLASGHWLTILRGGAPIRKAQACEYCSCDDCPSCPICGAPCPTVAEIPEGGSVEYEWGGLEYPFAPCPDDTATECLQETVAPPGHYTARFCWGLDVEGTPPCPAEVREVRCDEVDFEVPERDGVVEFTVDHGG